MARPEPGPHGSFYSAESSGHSSSPSGPPPPTGNIENAALRAWNATTPPVARLVLLISGLLVLCSLWLPWYRGEDVTQWETFSAWAAFDTEDKVFLAFAVALTLAAVAEFTVAGGEAPQPVRVLTALAAPASAVLSLLIFIRLFDFPWSSPEARAASDELGLSTTIHVGIVLALLSSIAATVAAIWLTASRGGFRTVLDGLGTQQFPSSHPAAASAESSGRGRVSDELVRLADLHTHGALDDQEFAAAKKATLTAAALPATRR